MPELTRTGCVGRSRRSRAAWAHGVGPTEPAAARSTGRARAGRLGGTVPPKCADVRASRVVRPPWICIENCTN